MPMLVTLFQQGAILPQTAQSVKHLPGLMIINFPILDDWPAGHDRHPPGWSVQRANNFPDHPIQWVHLLWRSPPVAEPHPDLAGEPAPAWQRFQNRQKLRPGCPADPTSGCFYNARRRPAYLGAG